VDKDFLKKIIKKWQKKTIGKDYKICKLLHKAENVREMPSIEKKKSCDNSRDILACIFLEKIKWSRIKR